MARTTNTALTLPAESELDEGRLQEAQDAATQLGRLNAEQASRAITIAQQVGYEGSMTVGAIEDEIRFYQRRTVEAILETGKRLLVLKELTPHGEFTSRVELLGFSDRTARRFMQAAAKTAKSAILADLSRQAKNGLAFLELVTHDDEVLEGLQNMDDFDRMSASQLRQKAREQEADLKASAEVMAGKDRKINEHARRAAKFNFSTDWPEQIDAAVKTIEQYANSNEALLGLVMQACEQAVKSAPADETAQQVWAQGTAAMAARVRDTMQRLKELASKTDAYFLETLGLYLED